MEHLKLPPRSRRIGCDDDVLRPTENSINPNLLRSNAGNRGVLCQVAEIKNVRLDRQAFAKILRIRLQYAIGSAVAPTGVEGRPGKERCRALRQGKFSAALEGLTDGLLGALPDGQGHFVA